jgi:hypothetical protein
MIHSRRARLPDPYFLGDRSPEDRDLPSHLVNRDLTPEQNPISAKPENLAPRGKKPPQPASTRPCSYPRGACEGVRKEVGWTVTTPPASAVTVAADRAGCALFRAGRSGVPPARCVGVQPLTKVAEPAPPVIRLTVYDSSRCRRLAWVGGLKKDRGSTPSLGWRGRRGSIHNPHCSIYFRSPSLARTLVPRT